MIFLRYLFWLKERNSDPDNCIVIAKPPCLMHPNLFFRNLNQLNVPLKSDLKEIPEIILKSLLSSVL